MTSFKFNSQIKIAASLLEYSQQDIKREPMLFRCDRETANRIGGKMTREFLQMLDEIWGGSYITVDSRVHMLMPGFWPCIPGWHHDDVPRERSDGQPNYINPSYHAEHCMAIVGNASVTEFALGSAAFPDVPRGSFFYREWHPLVDMLIENGVLSKVKAPVGQLVFFDWQTWHQGAPAVSRGFRWFIRATRNAKRDAANETRMNANVYLSDPIQGW